MKAIKIWPINIDFLGHCLVGCSIKANGPFVWNQMILVHFMILLLKFKEFAILLTGLLKKKMNENRWRIKVDICIN